ncbi:MAG: DUF1080 domain-containing protein [Bryobacteraceae bacterium]|nr:DUF1080 domain-containing protein [Bryobacteraceae bacterium]
MHSLLLCLALAQWQPLFDGVSLKGWRAAEFPNGGAVKVENGAIVLPPGGPMTGVNYTGALPSTNYEIRFEAARLQGNDFFASLTFPAGGAHATWVTGGWGGDIIGISSIDGWDASDNETRAYFMFETGRWYRFRLQVSDDRLRAWIDDEPVINVVITGRQLSLRPGPTKYSLPFGFAAYNTAGSIRRVELLVKK